MIFSNRVKFISIIKIQKYTLYILMFQHNKYLKIKCKIFETLQYTIKIKTTTFQKTATLLTYKPKNVKQILRAMP
jgi:hypothetical protein